MARYKFRAECFADVVEFYNQFKMVISILEVKTIEQGLPDMTVEFSSVWSWDYFIDKIDREKDLHVIIDTLELKENYSGVRKYLS